jgi:hypothetical protein
MAATKGNLLESPLLKKILTPILGAMLPKVAEKLGRRPVIAIGAAAAGLIGAVQILTQYGITLPPTVTTVLSVVIGIAGLLLQQVKVTPVAAPRLTAAQAAKVKVVEK